MRIYAETLAICIDKALNFLQREKIEGEVLIADNGSTDGSVEIAASKGVRIIHVDKKGYGSALSAGCNAAFGKYVIMGDADDSYNFSELMPFVDKLREGYDLVMGNRFRGGIEKGAMPLLHKYLGNPVLSFIGRLFYKSQIGDFHCGLRGYKRESIFALNLQTTGMEYASEMVVMAELSGLKITEVPTSLNKDGRSRPPHLRSFRDGWRHLKFLFMYSPDWLFLFPGLVLITIGILGGLAIIIGTVSIGNIHFDIHTLLYCMLFIIIGINSIYFYIFTKIYAQNTHFFPSNYKGNRLTDFSVDKGCFWGVVILFCGIALSIGAVIYWGQNSFNELMPEKVMRMVIPAVAMIEVGIETIFASFFIGVLKIKIKETDYYGKSN